MNALKLRNAVWEFDNEAQAWRLVATASRNRHILAVVNMNGAWQTFDTDGAGGESGTELFVQSAREEAEQSVMELGYL